MLVGTFPSQPIQSKDVSSIKLQPRQPRFAASQWPTDERSESQLNVAIELIEGIYTVLGYVGSLTQFAVVEVSDHGFPLDKNAGVSELEIAFLLEATHPGFRPISAPLV
jgi:hypothetical protein